jgi:hypothetical protein
MKSNTVGVQNDHAPAFSAFGNDDEIEEVAKKIGLAIKIKLLYLQPEREKVR